MNNNITANPFNLPFNAYAAFDASNLKSLMIERLNAGGVYTDQIYEGSNFNSLLDIIAYSYNVLLFYLNRTANESQYSQAQLYENMNRIVKALNYNPIGFQTSVLSFNAVAPSTIPQNAYTIPRYSYFTVNGVNYSFNTDATFIKTTSNNEELQQLNESALLYQGIFVEYPIYIATGQPYEQFSLAAISPDNTGDIIDHISIHVYVRGNDGVYTQWSRTNSLYLEGPNSKSFECRLGESQRYTIKFGNGVNGKQLDQGAAVAVYYLKSNGSRGEVGPNTLNNNTLFLYNTPQWNGIFNDIKTNQNYISPSQSALLQFTNPTASTVFGNLENTESIRNNAANTFKTQYRLITTSDFETYIQTNFSNLIYDVKVVNNWDYLSNHVRYLYNIGLDAPNNDSRVLYNQVMFADNCDFNNIYVYIVPKIQRTSTNKINNNFLSMGLKNLIIESLQDVKMTTSEIIMMDPVYTAVGIAVASNAEINGSLLAPSIIEETALQVTKSVSSRLSENELRNKIVSIFKDYFNINNTKLGQQIDIGLLTTQILSLEGVLGINSVRTVNGQTISRSGISLLAFNPIYNDSKEDIEILNQSYLLPYFKIPYLYNEDTILNQIKIITPDSQESGVREF